MRRRLSLNGAWNYQPIAHVTLKEDGLHEDEQNLPPGGEMILPVNWQLAGLDNFHGLVGYEMHSKEDTQDLVYLTYSR